MTVEHQLREPYAAHVREIQEQLVRLRAARSEALARVYELDQSIQAMERHIQSVIELEIKAADLPHPLRGYEMRDGRLTWEAQGSGEL